MISALLPAVARSAIVGRYANFPGYNHKTVYTTIYEKPDYPLQSFQDLTFNSFHYHHPMLMAVELIDYLVSEAGLRSGGQIGFPSRYSATAAYFQQKVYGDRPGQFYNRSNVWLWMPQRLLTNSSVQVNYLAARGDGNLCVALRNQSTQTVTTTVSLKPSLVAFGASHSIQVRTNNVEAPQQTLTAGRVTVNVAPKGITTAMFSSHDVHSPLLNPEQACGQCHTDTEYVVARVNTIQEQVAETKIATEDAILDAINAIKLAAEGATATADATVLDEARALHRKAQYMWDFVSAENSTGFHNPEYALRILAESTNYARQAQMLAAQAAGDPALLRTGTYYGEGTQ